MTLFIIYGHLATISVSRSHVTRMDLHHVAHVENIWGVQNKTRPFQQYIFIVTLIGVDPTIQLNI